MKRIQLILGAVTVWSALNATPPFPTGVDLNGSPVSPFKVSPATKAVVLFFTAPDCPISNRYAPSMSRLATTFADDEVKSWLVYSDDLADPEAIRGHLSDFNLNLPVVVDREFTIADFVGADVTPEAAIYVFGEPDRVPRLVYLGRIDDQYQGFGKYRPAATQHELRDLLTRIVDGETPAFTKTRAIGCYIPRGQ